MALQSLWPLAAFQSPDLFTVSRTPWMSDLLSYRDRQTGEGLLHMNTFHPYIPIRVLLLNSDPLHLKHSVLSLSEEDDLRSGRYKPFTAKLHLIEPVCMQTDHLVSIQVTVREFKAEIIALPAVRYG
jgi:hypothetical protein